MKRAGSKPLRATALWAHPEAIQLGDAQEKSCFVPFLSLVRDHRRAGRLRICLPRDIDQGM